MPEEANQQQQQQQQVDPQKEVEELRAQLSDPNFIKSLYEQGKALAEPEVDGDDLDRLLAELAPQTDQPAEEPTPQTGPQPPLDITQVVKKEVEAVRRELAERLEAERALSAFRSKHPDADDYIPIMWAVAKERPDLDKPGLDGLEALYQEAVRRVDALAQKRLQQQQEEAAAASSEKPSGPTGRTSDTAGKTLDDLLAEAQQEWEAGGSRSLLGG